MVFFHLDSDPDFMRCIASCRRAVFALGPVWRSVEPNIGRTDSSFQRCKPKLGALDAISRAGLLNPCVGGLTKGSRLSVMSECYQIAAGYGARGKIEALAGLPRLVCTKRCIYKVWRYLCFFLLSSVLYRKLLFEHLSHHFRRWSPLYS